MEKINFCSAMQPKSLKEFQDERCEFCADYYLAADVDAKFERMKSEREDMKLEILDLKRSYCHELAEVKRLKELDQAYECDRLRIKYAALLASARALVEEVAQEAHTMGRIYEKTLSPINPAIEFNRVSDMAKKKLEQAIAAIEAIISPPRSSPPPADTGRA